MEYVKIVCFSITKNQQEILTALLSEQAYIGFEETDNSLICYIEKENYNQQTLNAIVHAMHIEYTETIVPEENWNTSWERNFEPILVDNKVCIRANFHAPNTDVLHELIITPKMSFGTGHHATTRLMIQYMLEDTFVNKTVFDFGTGTGVLAIFAEKLDAKHVLCCDYDDWCIENTQENIEANQCKNTEIIKGSIETLTQKVDTIIANINLKINIACLQHYFQHLHTDGSVYISGFYYSDILELEDACKSNHITIVSKKVEDTWMALHLQKNTTN